MTVPATTRRSPVYTGNGVTLVFPFSFKVFLPTDIQVIVTSVGGTVSMATYITDYAVNLNADQTVSPGGSVTYQPGFVPLPTGAKLVIIGNIAYSQTLALPGGGNFNPVAIENNFDRTEMQIQQLSAGLDAAISVPVGETVPALPAAAVRAGYILGFDSLGNPVATTPVSGSVGTLITDLANSVTPSKGAGQIGFGYGLGYAAGTIGKWLQDLATSVGATVIGFVQQGTGAILRTISDKLFETVSVMDFIPASERAAIRSYTSVLDVSSYINAAIAAGAAAGARVRAPAGGYFGKFPVNFTARRVGLTGRGLIGDGADKTIFNFYTGNFPCIDATGQNTAALKGINCRSDNPGAFGLVSADCASMGLMMGRGNLTQSSNQLDCDDLRFNLTSDMTRNAGNGTIGILNNGGEHVIRNGIQIYANLPVCDHNGLQFTPSFSSNIPTIGVNYEQPYLGAAISCTIHESRNMQLIALDSYRAIWLHQVANTEWPNLYTSTRKLVSSVPAFAESFNFTGGCANVMIRCYQEASGLFGATYRMDHRYITHDGIENPDILVQRAVNDYGFTLPGSPSSSIHCLNNARLANGRINCNYAIGVYNASADNNGFAALPVTFAGTPNGFKNLRLTLDHSGAHGADIFGAIGPYCANVYSENFYTGENQLFTGYGAFTPAPTVVGTTSAGAATPTFATIAIFERITSKLIFVKLEFGWSAHTGTGNMQITGLPFTADASAGDQILNVSYNGLAVGAGKELKARVNAGTNTITLLACDPAGGALAAVPIDTAVTVLDITGCYRTT